MSVEGDPDEVEAIGHPTPKHWDRPYLWVELVGDEDKVCVWGAYPLALVMTEAKLRKELCVGEVPPVEPIPAKSKFVTEICIDDVLDIGRERLAMYAKLSKGGLKYGTVGFMQNRDIAKFSFGLMLNAAAHGGRFLVTNALMATPLEFIRGEGHLWIYRLAWSGCIDWLLELARGVPGLRYNPYSHTIRGPFEAAPRLLKLAWHVPTIDLDAGQIQAPAWLWTRDLLDSLKASLERRVRSVGVVHHEHIERKVLGVLYDGLSSLRHRNMGERMRNHLAVPGVSTPSEQIKEVERVVEVMPPCVLKLHERATGKATPHLQHDDLFVYNSFMQACGVDCETLVILQEGAHRDRIPDWHNYMRTTVIVQVNDVRKSFFGKKANPRNYPGHSCKTLFKRDLCPFAATASTVGHAQGQCQKLRAERLGGPSTKPEGAIVRYALTMRKALDQAPKKRTFFEASCASAAPPLDETEQALQALANL